MTDSGQSMLGTFQLGRWLIDGNALTASCGKETRAVEPRAFKVLKHLAERPGQLVSIEELMDAHWAGAVVTPNAVTRVIAHLRKVLDDDAKQPSFIETVPRTGYRCIASVGSTEVVSRPRRRLHLLAVAVFLVAVALYAVWPGRGGVEPTVAVLPFENLTGDTELDYLGDGVADEIISSLTQVGGLGVRSQSASFQFRGAERDLQESARELGVNYVVNGSVRLNGQSLRLTVKLLDPERNLTIWSSTEEHDILQVFAAQDEISRGVATAMADIANVEYDPSGGSNGPIAEAYDLYLRGRHVWHRRGTEPMQPAIDYFLEAVKIDPDFARGWGALATAYLSYPSYSPRGYSTWHLAEEAAGKALQLDPEISEAYGVLATFKHSKMKWAESEALYLEGLRRGGRSATTHFWYAEFLEVTGKLQQSAEHLARAVELDPTYQAPQLAIGFAHINFSDFGGAQEHLGKLWDRGFTTPLAWTANFMATAMRRDEQQLSAWIEVAPVDEQQKDFLRRYVAVDIRQEDDPSLVEELMEYYWYRPDYPLGMWLGARLGAPGRALQLANARLDRELLIELRPLWAPGIELRKHPAFLPFLERVGLLDYWESSGWGDVCIVEDDQINCEAKQLRPEVLEAVLSGE